MKDPAKTEPFDSRFKRPLALLEPTAQLAHEQPQRETSSFAVGGGNLTRLLISNDNGLSISACL
jgi:hypothetical protein